MGKEKTTQKQTVEATPEERELNKLKLDQTRAFDHQQRKMNENAGNLVNQLLAGQSLPGYLNTLPDGISPAVTPHLVTQSLRD